jgi:hypothetical protein
MSPKFEFKYVLMSLKNVLKLCIDQAKKLMKPYRSQREYFKRIALRNLRSISSSNNPQNGEMKFCENMKLPC